MRVLLIDVIPYWGISLLVILRGNVCMLYRMVMTLLVQLWLTGWYLANYHVCVRQLRSIYAKFLHFVCLFRCLLLPPSAVIVCILFLNEINSYILFLCLTEIACWCDLYMHPVNWGKALKVCEKLKCYWPASDFQSQIYICFATCVYRYRYCSGIPVWTVADWV